MKKRQLIAAKLRFWYSKHMKSLRLFWLPVWFIASFFIVGASVTLVNHLQATENSHSGQETQSEPLSPVAPILPATQTNPDIKGISTSFEGEDARAEIVASFLERHGSPLEPYDHFGEFLVDLADKNDMDYRLLPAIAMQESNLCKKIPEGSYNCLGFGIHSKGTLMFDSYEANFERAARELKKNYIDKGLTTPEKIMTKYTPHSNGSWANSVNQWIAEMEFNDRQKGREASGDADLTEYLSEQ